MADSPNQLHEFNFGAEVDWFFAQGDEALKLGLYLPACLSLIAGIEASLRVALADSGRPPQPLLDLDPRNI